MDRVSIKEIGVHGIGGIFVLHGVVFIFVESILFAMFTLLVDFMKNPFCFHV